MAAPGRSSFSSPTEGDKLGSYEKTFVVDGAEYELYAVADGESAGYVLVDHAGVKVIEEPLTEIPDDEAVRSLVQGRGEVEAA